MKYECRGNEQRAFNAEAIRRVLERTATPTEGTRRFVEATIFNLLIGNVDGHAKNFALL
jgi:serine/threonine-protein kinase HipA